MAKTIDDSAKGNLTQFVELFTVISCERKDFNPSLYGVF